MLCHREYTSNYSTELIIYRDKVISTNPNKALFHGLLDVHAFSPYAKNPNIRKFFSVLSWADELGSGVRNMTQYVPLYVEGAKPVFLEDDIFTTEVPLIIFTWKPYAQQFVSLFGDISEQRRKRMIVNLEHLPVVSDNAGELADIDAFIIEKVSRWVEKGGKLKKSKVFGNKGISKILAEKAVRSAQKGGKLFDKRTEYIVSILALALEPVSILKLIEFFEYKERVKFKKMYINPLTYSLRKYTLCVKERRL